MQNHKVTSVRSLKQIFLWPMVLGVFTLFGLVIALIEDGGSLEMISLIVLSVPAITMIYFYILRHQIRR